MACSSARSAPRATKESDRGSADLSGSLVSFCAADAADAAANDERSMTLVACAFDALDRENPEHVEAALRFLFGDDDRAVDMVRALLARSKGGAR